MLIVQNIVRLDDILYRFNNKTLTPINNLIVERFGKIT